MHAAEEMLGILSHRHMPSGAHRDEEEAHTAEGEAAGIAEVA